MTVHFIGAGPGAADLLTLRARDLIAACPVCLYAGSLVPPEVVGIVTGRAWERVSALNRAPIAGLSTLPSSRVNVRFP